MNKVKQLSIVPVPEGKRCWLILYNVLGFVFSLLPPFLTRYIVDDMIAVNKSTPLYWLALVIILAMFIHFFTFYFIRYKGQLFGNSICCRQAEAIGAKIASSSIPEYEAIPKGLVFNLLNSDIYVNYTFSSYLVSVPANSLIILSIFALLLATNPLLALVALLISPLYLLSSYANKKRLEELSKVEREAGDSLVQDVDVVANNKTSLSLFKAYPYVLQRFTAKLNRFYQIRNHKHFFFVMAQALPEFITTLAPMLILIIGSSFVVQGNLSLGNLLFSMQLVSMIFAPLTEITTLRVRLHSEKPVFQRYLDFMQVPERQATPLAQNSCPAALSAQSLHLRQLSLLRPDHSELFTIDDLQASTPGLILIKGDNGTGKTSLFNVLSGVYKAEQLQIKPEGLCHLGAELANNMVYLYNPNFLFAGTIAENICFGRTVDPNKLTQLLELLNVPPAEKQVRTRPENLSQGEKQKIFLARLLLSEAKLYILDEPNSNLDVETIASLRSYLAQLKTEKLLLIISHDDCYEGIADQIYSIAEACLRRSS